MDKYNPDSINNWVDYVRYICKHHARNFENYVFPAAIYGRDGTVIKANGIFRNLTGIKDGDIQRGAVNLFDLLDDNNAGLAEAAHNAFGGGESIYTGNCGLLCTKAGKSEVYQLNRLPNAIFFAMAYDRDEVEYAAVLLDSADNENNSS